MAPDSGLNEDDRYAPARRRMVDEQLAARGISDERVLDAMAAVPREIFVSPELRDQAYADRALPIGSGQTISQPYIVARMAELAAVKPDDRLLEVGAGGGYAAAVLARLAAHVVAVEVRPELAKAARRHLAEVGCHNVEVVTGDGVEIARSEGPFDVISVPAAPEEIPAALEESLADGGRLVIPVGPRRRQQLCLVTRSGDRLTRRPLEAVAFVPLVP